MLLLKKIMHYETTAAEFHPSLLNTPNRNPNNLNNSRQDFNEPLSQKKLEEAIPDLSQPRNPGAPFPTPSPRSKNRISGTLNTSPKLHCKTLRRSSSLLEASDADDLGYTANFRKLEHAFRMITAEMPYAPSS